MATLLQFGRNIRSRASRLENNSLRLTQQVAKTALRELVLGTPVDKGVTRSNWRVSLVNRTFKLIPAYSPGRNLGIGERANARATITVGNRVINRLRVGAKRGTGQAGSAVFITNNAVWISRLRTGYSLQQGKDWVDEAQVKAAGVVRSGTIRLLER